MMGLNCDSVGVSYLVLDTIWRRYIRVFLYENHSHLGGLYITGFDSNVKGFFFWCTLSLFFPIFS